MFKGTTLLLLFLLMSCSTTSFFEQKENFSLARLHNASKDEVIKYFGMAKNQYKISLKKGATNLRYTLKKDVVRGRGRFGSGGHFSQIDIHFQFGRNDKLGFMKVTHSYTGNSSGRKSKMKGEYESMCRAFTKEAGAPKISPFGVGEQQYNWKFTTKKGGTIKINSIPPKNDGKSEYVGYNYMVMTKVFFK